MPYRLIENKEMEGYKKDLPQRQSKSGNAHDFFITKGKETTRGAKIVRTQIEMANIEALTMQQAQRGLDRSEEQKSNRSAKKRVIW